MSFLQYLQNDNIRQERICVVTKIDTFRFVFYTSILQNELTSLEFSEYLFIEF